MSPSRWVRNRPVRILAALSILAGAVLTVSPAHSLIVSKGVIGGFEQEGDQSFPGLDPTVNGTFDWENVTPTVTVDDTLDSGFQGSSKELEPLNWTCNTGGGDPKKDNILRVYSNVRADPTSIFLDLAWIRESNNSSAHLNFELNQATQTEPPTFGNNTPCPLNRTVGDFLITYDFAGGSAQPDIVIYRWTGTTWDPTGIVATAAGAVNTAGPITDEVVGGTIPLGQFGEVTLDLTAPLGAPGGTSICDDFTTLNVRSRSSGNVIESALQDRVRGIGIELCGEPQPGRIIVEKQTDPNGATAVFGFTADYAAPFNLSDNETNDSGPLVVADGPFSVSETSAPPGWAPAPPSTTICSDGSVSDNITLSEGETVTCVFNNTLVEAPTGRIIVEKQTDPADSPATFLFLTNYGPAFLLADNGTSDSGPLGIDRTYSVSEEVPEGWLLTSAVCDDGSPIDAIALSANETVTCVFTDTQRGSITVVKDTVPDSGRDFSFAVGADVNGGESFVLDDDGPNGSDVPNSVTFPVDPGNHLVREVIADGYDLTSIVCDDLNSTGNIDTGLATFRVGAGEHVTCVFTNTKQVVYGEDPGDTYGDDPYGNDPGDDNSDPFAPGGSNTTANPTSDVAGVTQQAPTGTQPDVQAENQATQPALEAIADPAVAPAGTLPRTGAGIRHQASIGLALMAGGLIVLLGVRRRRSSTQSA